MCIRDRFQANQNQFVASAAVSLLLFLYTFTLPHCPVVKSGEKKSLADALGLIGGILIVPAVQGLAQPPPRHRGGCAAGEALRQQSHQQHQRQRSRRDGLGPAAYGTAPVSYTHLDVYKRQS